MVESADVIIVGAGLAGLVAAAELGDRGKKVILLDQEPPQSLGGQAFWSLGGLFMVLLFLGCTFPREFLLACLFRSCCLVCVSPSLCSRYSTFLHIFQGPLLLVCTCTKYIDTRKYCDYS